MTLEYSWIAAWVAQETALAETLPPEQRGAHLAWLADYRAQLAVEYAASCAANVRWRTRLCTWLEEAEEALARARQEMLRAKARAHRAFRTDEVRAAEQHCRQAAEQLDEAMEQVQVLAECLATWTPDGHVSALGQGGA